MRKNPLRPIEFPVRDKPPVNNERKPQNVTLQPSRFEEKEEEEEATPPVVLSPLATNLPLASAAASAMPLVVEPVVEEENEPAFHY